MEWLQSLGKLTLLHEPAGVAQSVERRALDRKVVGLNLLAVLEVLRC